MGNLRLVCNNTTRGLNKNYPPQQIQDNELSECRDVVLRRLGWTKRPGSTNRFNTTADIQSILEVVDYLRNDGTLYLLAFTEDNAYRLNGASWASIGSGFTGTVYNKWFTAEIGGNIYASNGVNTIRTMGSPGSFSAISWDTSTDPDGDVGISVTRASVILSFNNRLLFMNTTDSQDGLQPTRVQWTEANDFDRVENTNFLNLDDNNSPILSGRQVNNGLIAIYKEDSIYTLQNAGAPATYIPRYRTRTGILGPKAVTDVPQGNFFASRDGFFIFTGGGLIPLGEDRITEYFQDILVEDYSRLVYCYTRWNTKEVFILIPTTPGTERPTHILVYNWQFDVFYEWARSAHCGFYKYRAIPVGTVYWGSTGGQLVENTGSTDNSVAIADMIRTKAFSELPFPNFPRPPDIMQTNRILTDAQPTSALVGVATADFATEAPTLTQDTITATDGMANHVDLKPVFARYFMFQANNFDTVSEFIAEFEPSGDT